MGAAPSEICVPLDSLTMGSGEDSSSTVAPEVGDPVDFSATGTVSRVEGGNAYLTLESVNGKPLPEAAAPAAEPTADDMRALGASADENEAMPA